MGIVANIKFNMNKHNLLHAGCHIKLLQEIVLKRAIINVQTADNACFAVWSVVAVLCPAQKNVKRESSYPHYTSVLNFVGEIVNRISNDVNQIKKFETLNDISINVFINEKGILPIRRLKEEQICKLLIHGGQREIFCAHRESID